jgi:hypothetical protein
MGLTKRASDLLAKICFAKDGPRTVMAFFLLVSTSSLAALPFTDLRRGCSTTWSKAANRLAGIVVFDRNCSFAVCWTCHCYKCILGVSTKPISLPACRGSLLPPADTHMQEDATLSDAFEETYVHGVYDQIASHFSSTRYKASCSLKIRFHGLNLASHGL